MSKAFIELKGRQRKYKLNANDIGRLYKISKRKTPSIPAFEERPKAIIETDDDCEVIDQTNY